MVAVVSESVERKALSWRDANERLLDLETVDCIADEGFKAGYAQGVVDANEWASVCGGGNLPEWNTDVLCLLSEGQLRGAVQPSSATRTDEIQTQGSNKVATNNWISVLDKLPEPDVFVEVAAPSGYLATPFSLSEARHSLEKGWVDAGFDRITDRGADVAHWRHTNLPIEDK